MEKSARGRSRKVRGWINNNKRWKRNLIKEVILVQEPQGEIRKGITAVRMKSVEWRR